MRLLPNRVLRLGRCDRGSTAVEFALVGMLLIGGSLIVIDGGRALWMYHRLSDAMERAGRNSLLHPMTDNQISLEIERQFPEFGTDTPLDERPKVEITSEPDFRTVKVSLSLKTVVPVSTTGTLDLSLRRRFPKAPPPTS